MFAAALRLTTVWLTALVAKLIGVDISSEIFDKTLHQPYQIHTERNSAEVAATVFDKSNYISKGIILTSLRATASLAVLVALASAVVWVEPLGTLLGVSFFTFVYWLILKSTRRPLTEAGAVINNKTGEVFQIVNEGLGGIREVIIGRAQPLFSTKFKVAHRLRMVAEALAETLNDAPKILVEASGLVTATLLITLLLTDTTQLTASLPVIAAIVLAVQKALPHAQALYKAWAHLKACSPVAAVALDLIEKNKDQEVNKVTECSIQLDEHFSLQNVTFQYTNAPTAVLEQINLVIYKGSTVGFKGTTGSGKSTLIDLLTGLISPSSGNLRVDDKIVNAENANAWYSQIAHIPQDIFLLDGTIAENIAFGLSHNEIDIRKIQHAAQAAQIHDFVSELPDGYDTYVGDRGVRLSGGQRQRIGIARALYREAPVLILDEATSALDEATEADVMDAIHTQYEGTTILMIAHRLSTLERCDRLIQIEKGKIIDVGVQKAIA